MILSVTAVSAKAFYWPGWPGAGTTQTTTTVSTKSTTPTTGTTPTTPSEVPEPATLILGGIGLVAAMGTRAFMKQRKV